MNDNNLIQQYLRLYTFTTERNSLVWSYEFEKKIRNYSVELVGFPADYLEDVFLFNVSGLALELRLGGGQLTLTEGRIYINVELAEMENELETKKYRICIYTRMI